MSLIIARKDGVKLGIISDTKLTYPNHETKNLKTSPLDGIVKTIILNDNFCISYAGEIEQAALAIKEINDSTDANIILQTLEKYHNLSQGKTEFLFCVGKPKLTIYEFKNGEINNTNASWIGNKEAFNSFQENLLTPVVKKEPEKTTPNPSSSLNTNQPVITITDMNLTFEVSQNSDLLSKLSSAMDKVIEDGNIDTVGGFKVNVIYDNKFFYNGYIKNYRSNVIMVGDGMHNIGHGTANDGSYSINFIGGSSDFKSLALHVSQGNFGIIYTRKDNGLLFPIVFNLDEVDFLDHIQDKFKITANFSTQDRVQKYFQKAVHLFNERDYKQSEDFFNKAFHAAKGVEKANVLFNKGIILLRLNDKTAAMKVFSETVALDSSFTAKILSVLHPKR